MNIEQIRDFCLSLPMTGEDTAFGEDILLFRVCGKIFGCYDFNRNNYFVVKTDPDYTLELRDRYPEVEPAWHWNKKYWNQLRLDGSLNDDFILGLIRHSYSEVVKKLPRRVRAEHPGIDHIG